MLVFQKYYTQPETVDAVQWDGTGQLLEELYRLLPEVGIAETLGNGLYIDKPDGPLSVRTGDYIYVLAGEVYALSPEKFRARYKPC